MKGLLHLNLPQLCALLVVALVLNKPAIATDGVDTLDNPNAEMACIEDIQLKQVLHLLNSDAHQEAQTSLQSINLKFSRNGNPLLVNVIGGRSTGSKQLENDIRHACQLSKQCAPQTKKMKLVFLQSTEAAKQLSTRQTSALLK